MQVLAKQEHKFDALKMRYCKSDHDLRLQLSYSDINYQFQRCKFIYFRHRYKEGSSPGAKEFDCDPLAHGLFQH